ncbi:Fic family protein [Halieaceae bacterium IMCC14734]|uniref:Fic family protein n=2 Tax=Candidatus Litorirhabdus singularis TaxID=2518993 RepID=A0ABT3TKU2_9GAMM|nr:Fic family protein [Candidatus Litorirhabdus singularis]
MEPMKIAADSAGYMGLVDLALDLASASEGFKRSMPEGTVRAVADMVRSMNCYYSNLIEGHDTHPIDIERALANDYSEDAHKRELQLEAKAHIEVQQWIDAGGLAGRAVSEVGLRETHRRFCELLPAELLWVKSPMSEERIAVVPGELRQSDVQVGRHVAVSPGAVPRFLQHFESAYGNLGKTEALVSLAASHHRLLWIHPFVDGNGRVARLMSHALLLDVLDTGGVWSIARGLARSAAEYKATLQDCDSERRGGLDGRGNLSQSALTGFTHYFLSTCIDQIKFMEGLVSPNKVRDRIQSWCRLQIESGILHKKSPLLLDAVLFQGQVKRGEVEHVLQVAPRTSRRVVADLLGAGILASDGVKSPLRIAFPAKLAAEIMPGLFPEV